MSVIFPQKTFAAIAGHSAQLIQIEVTQLSPIPVRKPDERAIVLQTYLSSYNSPLASYAQVFITQADVNNIDWRLLPAIAGVESDFGTAIPAGSYNGWGFGIYGNHCRYFDSWDNAIITIAQSLRGNYINKWGAKNIYQIGHIYAADPLWANKVLNYMDQLGDLEITYQANNQPLPISL